jgi:Mg2+/Co2+ transporter CorB
VTPEQETWYDEAAGPVFRAYAVTRGRTSGPQVALEVLTLVVIAQPVTPKAAAFLEPEHLQILSLCTHPISIAELSARLSLTLGVVKILIGDLLDMKLIICRSAATPDLHVLQAVLNGLHRL